MSRMRTTIQGRAPAPERLPKPLVTSAERVRQCTAQRPAGTLDVIAHSAGVPAPTLKEHSCEREHGSGHPLSYGNKSWMRSTAVSRSRPCFAICS